MAGLRSLHDVAVAAVDGSESAYLRCGGVDDATKAASPFDGWERISSVGLKQFRRAKAELWINNLGCLLASVLPPLVRFF